MTSAGFSHGLPVTTSGREQAQHVHAEYHPKAIAGTFPSSSSASSLDGVLDRVKKLLELGIVLILKTENLRVFSQRGLFCGREIQRFQSLSGVLAYVGDAVVCRKWFSLTTLI